MKQDNVENIAKVSLLYDFYGGLLSEKQRDIVELYHEENLSLQEISAELGITRQGVHEALKKAERLLEEYEDKLGLVNSLMKSRKALSEIDSRIESLIGTSVDEEIRKELTDIKNIIDKLEE